MQKLGQRRAQALQALQALQAQQGARAAGAGGSGGGGERASAPPKQPQGLFGGEESSEDESAPAAAPAGRLGVNVVGGEGGSLDALMRTASAAPAALETSGDELSTNIQLRGLAKTVTEELLEKVFGGLGEVMSIRVMWPRTDEERAREANTGFVAFRTREAAVAAMEAMQGHVLHGRPLHMSWGKPLRGLGGAGGAEGAGRGGGGVGGGGSERGEEERERGVWRIGWSAQSGSVHAGTPRVQVSPPADVRVRRRIDRFAALVARDAEAVEAEWMREVLQARESGGRLWEDFWWLVSPQSPEGVYYRWRCVQLVEDEGVAARGEPWSTEPFQLMPGGVVYIPPPPPPARHADGSGPDGHDSASTWTDSGEDDDERPNNSNSNSNSSSVGIVDVPHRRRRRDGRGAGKEREGRAGLGAGVWAVGVAEADRNEEQEAREEERWRRLKEAARRREAQIAALDAARPTAASLAAEARDMTGMSGGGVLSGSGAGVLGGSIHGVSLSVGAQEQLALRHDPLADPPLRSLLTDRQVRAWGSVLQRVTMDAESVARAATWALDRPHLADAVAGMLGVSLALPHTPLRSRIARLYVACDILHGAALPLRRVASFRQALAPFLPVAMAALGAVRREIAASRGRISERALSARVEAVVHSVVSNNAVSAALGDGLLATFHMPADVADAERPREPHLRALALWRGSDERDITGSRDIITGRDHDAAEASPGLQPDSLVLQRLRKDCAADGLEATGSADDLRRRIDWRTRWRAGGHELPAADTADTDAADFADDAAQVAGSADAANPADAADAAAPFIGSWDVVVDEEPPGAPLTELDARAALQAIEWMQCIP